ncbi:hypothetical protein HPB50_010341 [Hyalomma asiaticum]|uniref:Uncharacterized protein n=1 Tax=Hyalomma asiaticum TaxID=266040 RepID=A0ACB7T482_HYAAI|nr:hypothetical protein HPB50_010341 [Hyalomma asiaticum]
MRTRIPATMRGVRTQAWRQRDKPGEAANDVQVYFDPSRDNAGVMATEAAIAGGMRNDFAHGTWLSGKVERVVGLASPCRPSRWEARLSSEMSSAAGSALFHAADVVVSTGCRGAVPAGGHARELLVST